MLFEFLFVFLACISSSSCQILPGQPIPSVHFKLKTMIEPSENHSQFSDGCRMMHNSIFPPLHNEKKHHQILQHLFGPGITKHEKLRLSIAGNDEGGSIQMLSLYSHFILTPTVQLLVAFKGCQSVQMITIFSYLIVILPMKLFSNPIITDHYT